MPTTGTCALSEARDVVNAWLQWLTDERPSDPDSGELSQFLAKDDRQGFHVMELDPEPGLPYHVSLDVVWERGHLKVHLTVASLDGSRPCAEHQAVLDDMGHGARVIGRTEDEADDQSHSGAEFPDKIIWKWLFRPGALIHFTPQLWDCFGVPQPAAA
jgi:hypothetical protein